MGDEEVAIDPDALVAFAQAIAPATNELYGHAMDAHLVKDLMQVRSHLPNGVSFMRKHMAMANEFSDFMMDAAAGCVSLAYAADLIAISVTVTDETSASELARLLEQVRAQGRFDPKKPVRIIDVSDLEQHRSGGQADVRSAFTPIPPPKQTSKGGPAKPGDGKVTTIADALRIADEARRRREGRQRGDEARAEQQRHAGDTSPQGEMLALRRQGENDADTVTKIGEGYCFVPPRRDLPFLRPPTNRLAPNPPDDGQ